MDGDFMAQFTAMYWMAVGKQQRTNEETLFAHRVMEEMKQMSRLHVGQGHNNAVPVQENEAQPPRQGISCLVAPPANFGVAPQAPANEDVKPIISRPARNDQAGPSNARDTAHVVVKTEPASQNAETPRVNDAVGTGSQIQVKQEVPEAHEAVVAAPVPPPAAPPQIEAQPDENQRRRSTRLRNAVPGPSNANKAPQVGIKQEVGSQVPAAPEAQTPQPPGVPPHRRRMTQVVVRPASPEALPPPASPVPSEANGYLNQNELENNDDNAENVPPTPPPVDYTPAPFAQARRPRVKPEPLAPVAENIEDRPVLPAAPQSNKRRGKSVNPLKGKRARRESSLEPVHRFNLRRGCRTAVNPEPIKIGFVNELNNDFPMPTLVEPYVLTKIHGSSVPAVAMALLIVTDNTTKKRQFSRNVPMAIVVMKDGESPSMTLKGKKMDPLMNDAIRAWKNTM